MSSLITLPTDLLRGHRVIPYAPNGPGDRGHTWDTASVSDATPSGLRAVSADAATNAETFTLSYVGLSRSQARTLESFINDRSGAYEGFWCPSFQHEFTIVQAGASGVPFVVLDWGYATTIYPLGFPFTQFAAYYPSMGWYLGELGLSAPPSGGRANFNNGTAAVGDVEVIRNKVTSQGLIMMRLHWVRLADEGLKTEWAHPNLASITLTVVTDPKGAPVS